MSTTPAIIENKLMDLLKEKKDLFTEDEMTIIVDWVTMAVTRQEVEKLASPSYGGYCDLPSRGY